MITVDALTVEFGGTTLFKDISFQINPKDRIALMGKNGAGKSTLLKIIAGVRTATRGSVSVPKDCVVAYLPQHLITDNSRTVFEETCQAFAPSASHSGGDRPHQQRALLTHRLRERLLHAAHREAIFPLREVLRHRHDPLRGGRRKDAPRTRLRTFRLQPSHFRILRRMANAHRTG